MCLIQWSFANYGHALQFLPSEFTHCSLGSRHVLFAQAWVLVCSKLPIDGGLFRTDEIINGANAVREGSCRLRTMPCTCLFWSGKIGVCVFSLLVCVWLQKNEQTVPVVKYRVLCLELRHPPLARTFQVT